MRMHSGYGTGEAFGSGGYYSSWEMRDSIRLEPVANPIRPVFLVNAKGSIPLLAVAVQKSGAGAIVSEDPLDERQLDLRRPVPVLGSMRALVRMQEIASGDGTTGVSANVVLHKTGEEALKAAAEIARSGNWPLPQPTKLDLPAARFAEKNYSDQPYPSAEYRMLAAARIWAVFHYFHPYKHLYGEDWNAVLTEFLPKMARAENARDYHLAVAEMVARTRDTHCYVGSGELSEVYGVAPPPIEVRWIESRPVVTRILDASLKESVRPGDVVTRIDGAPSQNRVDELSPRLAASTPQSMMNRVMQLLLNGRHLSRVRVGLQSAGGSEREIELLRDAENMSLFRPSRTGEAFRLINDKLGYVDLERLSNAQVDAMFDKLGSTDFLIMDMRGYPQGTAWSIVPRLSEKTSPVAAQFRRNLLSAEGVEGNNINSFLFEQRIPATGKPRYRGKTVMLIDERAISQSEHSGLFYKAANGTVFVGSLTTGANGDVTYFYAPGGIRINFSGHDVRWPDGRQLQRVGLIPDIEVRPTIEGIRTGRDEVLERAIAYVQNGR
jgi:C-terminal processing protease CtpA/Prc